MEGRRVRRAGRLLFGKSVSGESWVFEMVYNHFGIDNGEKSSDADQFPEEQGDAGEIRVWYLYIGMCEAGTLPGAMRSHILYEVCV